MTFNLRMVFFWNMSTNGEPLKIVTVGDATVGKTALLVRYSKGKFAVDDYKPTLLEQSLVTVNYHEENYQVELIDTGGQEDFEQIRKKYYSEADIFLLCFDISSPTTFSNVKAKVSSAMKGELQKNEAPSSPLYIFKSIH